MNSVSSDRAGMRLLYVVTEDWYFMSHRLPMARAARNGGYEIHVATRVKDHGDAIRAEGFHVHPLRWKRSERSPVSVLGDIWRLRQLYRRIRPDIVHHIALKPTLLGSLATLGLDRVAIVNTIAGLGHAFAAEDIPARVMRAVVRRGLRALASSPRSRTIVQNGDDRAVLLACGVQPERICLVRGSGVDIQALKPLPEPTGPVRAAFVGRMLTTKGVEILIEAHRLLAARGVPLGLSLAGEPDPDNAASLRPERMKQLAREPGIDYLGYVGDIGALWASAHIAVLPSFREGLPKSLIEAAACGRPIVAADVPGCREIAVQDVNALLVPAGDPNALADALERLAKDAAMRIRFGQAGRRLVEAEFSSERIGAETLEVYNSVLAQNVCRAQVAGKNAGRI